MVLSAETFDSLRAIWLYYRELCRKYYLLAKWFSLD
jgi:hypothetical protein